VGDVVGIFFERVEDYRAVVVRCGPDQVADRVREGLADATRVVVPAGLPTPGSRTASSGSPTTRP
jgi:L-lactate dehydrogenase complex protein LldG